MKPRQEATAPHSAAHALALVTPTFSVPALIVVLENSTPSVHRYPAIFCATTGGEGGGRGGEGGGGGRGGGESAAYCAQPVAPQTRQAPKPVGAAGASFTVMPGGRRSIHSFEVVFQRTHWPCSERYEWEQLAASAKCRSLEAALPGTHRSRRGRCGGQRLLKAAWGAERSAKVPVFRLCGMSLSSQVEGGEEGSLRLTPRAFSRGKQCRCKKAATAACTSWRSRERTRRCAGLCDPKNKQSNKSSERYRGEQPCVAARQPQRRPALLSFLKLHRLRQERPPLLIEVTRAVLPRAVLARNVTLARAVCILRAEARPPSQRLSREDCRGGRERDRPAPPISHRHRAIRS